MDREIEAALEFICVWLGVLTFAWVINALWVAKWIHALDRAINRAYERFSDAIFELQRKVNEIVQRLR